MTALAPLELAGRLALAVGLAVFMGLAYEETYKTEERSSPGGIRTFPMLAMCGATLYLIEPAHALAFITGLLGLVVWLHAYLRRAPATPQASSFMIPASNLLVEADLTTQDWDYNWWGDSLMNNIEYRKIKVDTNLAVHAQKPFPLAEVVLAIERQVRNTQAFCRRAAEAQFFQPGCPIQYNRPLPPDSNQPRGSAP